MKKTDVGAARLWRVAKAFTEVAETLIEDHAETSTGNRVGKRKRDPNAAAESGNPKQPPSSIKPNELAFVRPLQQSHSDRNEIGNARSVFETLAGTPNGDANHVAQQSDATMSMTVDQPTNVEEQVIQAANQGPLVFDWLMWDQYLDPNAMLGFDLPFPEDATGADGQNFANMDFCGQDNFNGF